MYNYIQMSGHQCSQLTPLFQFFLFFILKKSWEMWNCQDLSRSFIGAHKKFEWVDKPMSPWILRSVESKLFPYIRNTWVASNHWSVLSAFNAPVALTPSAWGRQSHEGVSYRVPFEASRRFLSYDEYYGNWRTRNMPSTRIIVVNPYHHCKTSPYSWLQNQLIFLPHQLPPTP